MLKFIEALSTAAGGNAKLASRFGVTPGAVSQWRKAERIPLERLVQAADLAVEYEIEFDVQAALRQSTDTAA